MITPSIGRVVWFWPTETESYLNVLDPAQPFNGTIVLVTDARKVNIAVLDHLGCGATLVDTVLRQPEDAKPAGSYAEWMPNQIAEASAT